MIKSCKNLDVYNLSYEVAMEIFEITKNFPKEEQYSLTSQMVRLSRSVSANISEGWAKRNYENYFKQHLILAIGSNSETMNWLNFAKDCRYISDEEASKIIEKLNQVGRMLTKLPQNWNTFE